MPTVEFSKGNAVKCLCPTCPVQATSECVAEQLSKLVPLDASDPAMPPAEELPGLYCSRGHASCTGLRFEEACQCGGCLVFSENSLHTGKFCLNGPAAMLENVEAARHTDLW